MQIADQSSLPTPYPHTLGKKMDAVGNGLDSSIHLVVNLYLPGLKQLSPI